MSVSIGVLYQETAEALANAAHNATQAQQQTNVTMQAATTMGVATLYNIDTASTAVAMKEIFDAAVAPVQHAAPPAELAATPEVQEPLRKLIERGSPHESFDVAYHMRALMTAFAASLGAISAANARTQLRILQNAATTVCLKAMIEQPDKRQEFEEILQIIRRVI